MSLTKEITKGLFLYFEKHRYMLANSYIYKWESDFFSQLKSGYHQEIEVKISRADFFNDFKKEGKHMILDRKNKGQKLVTFKGPTAQRVKYEDIYGHKKITWTYSSAKIKGEISREEMYTSINIEDFNCPNRFYYCCPEGLIKPEEVPEYAGLMYYSKEYRENFKKIKNAPLIHREKRNLAPILLDKFYFRYLNTIQ